MDLKYGKALVGAIAAVTVSAFSVPFCANASASTGTMITRHDAGSAIQLAQAEQEESVEKRSEEKTKEVQSGTNSAPGAAHGRSWIRSSSLHPPPPRRSRVRSRGSTKRARPSESEHSENGMGVSGSVGATSERRENDMSSDANANACAPGTTVEQEHSEEHQAKEKVEQN